MPVMCTESFGEDEQLQVKHNIEHELKRKKKSS